MSSIEAEPTLANSSQATASGRSPWHRLMPWMAGSGMAMGQAVLATACSLPTVGKCVGCGSCVVGVATLYSWALNNRKADKARAAQGLEPFEIRTGNIPDHGESA